MKRHMNLSIITVTYNSADQIRTVLNSVRPAIRDLSYEVLVADNGSSDETVSIVKNEYRTVKLFELKHNAGFAAANNLAAKEAAGDYLLFLNPDMRLEPESLDKIVGWINSRPDVGIASCKLVDRNGQFCQGAKPRRLPHVFDQIMILLKIPHIFPGVLNKYLYSDFDSEIEQEVDSVRGSFLLMRRSLYEKLGWAFDPRYFIWFEDVDICRECRRAGLKVVYTPIISCVDYLSQSFNKKSGMWKQKNFTMSMLIYFRKWEPWHKWFLIALFRPVAIALTFISGR